MSVHRYWTVSVTDEYQLPRLAGTTMHSITPTPAGPPPADAPRHWWSGEGTLDFEGIKWSGAQMSDGMLLEIGAVEDTPNLEEEQVSIRLALGNDALRRAMTVDTTPLHVEIGWIQTNDYGRTWFRLDSYRRGTLGEINMVGGVLEVDVESYLDQIGRGRLEVISASTHPDLSEMTELGSGLATDVPVFE